MTLMINLNQVRNNCLKSVPSSSFQTSDEVQDQLLESNVSVLSSHGMVKMCGMLECHMQV